jgi:hypothetical protein
MKKNTYLGCFILSFVLLFSSIVFADNAEPHVHAGGFSSASSLKYWTDSSVSSYGYSTHTQHSGAAWNGISSKVSISSQASERGAHIVVYAGSLSNETWWASADYYKSGWFGTWTQVGITDPRDRTRIRINDYKMDQSNFTSDNAKHSITHEFGHALSLGHTTGSSEAMTQGQLTNINPSSIDKGHLKNKWGN